MSAEAAAPASPRWLAHAGAALALALCAWSIVYLFFAVPGPWFGSAPMMNFSGAKMVLSRGAGHVDGTRFIVQATDAAGLAIITLELPALRASDYRRVRWTLTGREPDAELALLWRTDYVAQRINSAPLAASPEGAQVVMTPGERNWIGRIGGIALTIRGKLAEPLVIENVSVDAMGAAEVVVDRLRDWFGHRPWNGLSINSALGGPQEQPVWFPLAIAIIALSAIALWMGWRRWRGSGSNQSPALTVIAIVAVAWIALDARWLWTRLQRAQATAASFSGKSPEGKHLADLDGNVYLFAEKLRAKIPDRPARIYVSADDHYFRARLAYHLYPHNIYIDHASATLPAIPLFKPGEYIAVFRRRGVVYDPVAQTVRWDDQPPVRAELLIAEDGNAAFKVF